MSFWISGRPQPGNGTNRKVSVGYFFFVSRYAISSLPVSKRRLALRGVNRTIQKVWSCVYHLLWKLAGCKISEKVLRPSHTLAGNCKSPSNLSYGLFGAWKWSLSCLVTEKQEGLRVSPIAISSLLSYIVLVIFLLIMVRGILFSLPENAQSCTFLLFGN